MGNAVRSTVDNSITPAALVASTGSNVTYLNVVSLGMPKDISATGSKEYASAAASNAGLETIAKKINTAVDMLMSDTKVKNCISGRDTKNLGKGVAEQKEGRFPNLLDPYVKNIINMGLENAKGNYNKKLEELRTEAMTAATAKMAEDKAANAGKICLNAAQLPAVKTAARITTVTSATITEAAKTGSAAGATRN